MNTPNPTPFTPSGFGPNAATKGRARLKLAILVVLAMHVLLFGGLLLQGCKREPTERVPVYGETQPPPPLSEPAPLTTEPAPAAPDLTTAAPPATIPTVAPSAPLPAPAPAVAPPLGPTAVAPAPGAQEYVVAAGDTFYSIGQKFGVSMKAIADANPGVDPRRLRIGHKLVIPAPQEAAPTATAAVTAPGEIIYTVKSGDNLTRIAAQHGTTVKALRAANNLTTDRIKVGDKLRIPVGAPTQPAPTQP